MAFNFPLNPTSGQQITAPSGIVYQFDGTKWLNTAQPTLYATLNTPHLTGSPTAPTPAYGDADTSVATTAFVQQAVVPSFDNSGRNLLHNGLFNVQQRGAGAWTTNGAYTADRWMLITGGDTASVTVGSIADASKPQIGDEAAQYTLATTFTGGAAAGNYIALTQRVEGLRRLAGKTVTLSFWAGLVSGSNISIGVSWGQLFGSGGSPSTNLFGTGIAVPLAGGWNRYSVTFTLPSVIGKTIGTTATTDSTDIELWYSSGSTQAARAGVGVQSGQINLWGVQLEFGSVATPVEKLDPMTERQLCMRYYQTLSNNLSGGVAAAGGATYWGLPLSVTMRATPTASFGAISYSNASAMGAWTQYPTVSNIQMTITAAGQYYGTAPLMLTADL